MDVLYDGFLADTVRDIAELESRGDVIVDEFTGFVVEETDFAERFATLRAADAEPDEKEGNDEEDDNP